MIEYLDCGTSPGTTQMTELKTLAHNSTFRILSTGELYPLAKFQGAVPTVRLSRRLELLMPVSTETPRFGLKYTDQLEVTVWVKILRDPMFEKTSPFCSLKLGRVVHVHSYTSQAREIDDLMETQVWFDLEEDDREFIVEKMTAIRQDMARLEHAQSLILHEPAEGGPEINPIYKTMVVPQEKQDKWRKNNRIRTSKINTRLNRDLPALVMVDLVDLRTATDFISSNEETMISALALVNEVNIAFDSAISI